MIGALDKVDSGLRDQLGEAAARRSHARKAGDIAAWIRASIDCGQIHFKLDDMDLMFARKLLTEASKLIEEHHVLEELLPEVLGMIGRTLQRMKRWNEVLPWYAKAASAAEAHNLPAERMRWLFKEASTCFAMNDAKQGHQKLAAAFKTGRALLARGEPVAGVLADQYERMAIENASKDDVVLENLARADKLLKRLPRSAAHLDSALNRAELYGRQKKVWVAQTYLEEALELADVVGVDEKRRRLVALQLAQLLRDRHEPVQAAAVLRAEATKCTEHRARHQLWTGVVNCLFEGHAWKELLTACVDLREIRENMELGQIYDLELRASVACRGLGDLTGALERLDAAQQYATQLVPEASRKARAQRAIVLLDHRDFAASVRLGEEVIAEGMTGELVTRTLVRALIGAGNLDRAEQVVGEFERTDGASETQRADVARMRAYLADGGRGDAKAAWQAVTRVARSGSVRAEAFGRLIALGEGNERLNWAVSRLRLLDYMRDDVSDVFSDDSWRAAYESADELASWLDDFVRAAVDPENHETFAFEIERFRAQTLVSYLAEREALWRSNEIPPGWLKGRITTDLRRARYQFEAMRARGVSWRERRVLAIEIEDLARMALSAEGVILFAPAEQSVHFPERFADLLATDLLGAGECLLFAHALPDRLDFWAISPQQNRRLEIPTFGRGDAERMHRDLRTIGRGDDDPDLAVLLDELDQRLARALAAWLTELGMTRAFLSAGTLLAALPLDCTAAFLAPGGIELAWLPNGKALGFVRGTRKPIPDTLFIVDQARRDAYSVKRMQETRGRALVVSDPSRDLDFAPLEVALVASAYAASQTQILDKDLLEPGGLASACRGVDVLHFTGHGEFDSTNPYKSGLTIGAASRGAPLWTNGDIFGSVDAPSGRLAVLSGCETGQTQPNLLSEEVSLPAAFIAAGYAAVVASRWAVDDLPSTLLMADFHRRWMAGGISVTTALRESQLWLRGLHADDARSAISQYQAIAAKAIPRRAAAFRRLCTDALEIIEADSDEPFANPLSWAAFFVSGDGTITADGVDPRVPLVEPLRTPKRKTTAKQPRPRARTKKRR